LAQGGIHDLIHISFSPQVVFPLVAAHTETITVTVTNTATSQSQTVTVKYTIDACNPPAPDPVLCDGKVFINRKSPTCGSNGELSIRQVTVIGEETIPCDVVWRTGAGMTVNGNLLTGVSAGAYHVEINCGELSCSHDVVVREAPGNGSRENGLLGKYYAATDEECKFLAENIVLRRTDNRIDFDWSKENDPALTQHIYSVRWSGMLTAPNSGTYYFYATANASGTLYVNEQEVTEAGIALQAGKEYPVVYDLTGFSKNTTNVKLEWELPGVWERELIRPCHLEPRDLGDGCDACDMLSELDLLPPVIDLCKGEQSVTLEARGNGIFLWSTGETGSTITVDKSGFYTVKLINHRCNETREQEVEVRSSDNLEKNATATGNKDLVCEGQPVNLNAAGGKSYKWYPADFLSSPNSANTQATPVGTTTYTVEITTEGGCKVNRSVTVTVEPKFEMEVNVYPGAGGCDGDTVTIEAGGAGDYTWSPESELIYCDRCASARHVINGNRTITVYGTKGACRVEEQVQITSRLSAAENFGFSIEENPADGCALKFAANDYEGYDQFTWDFGDGRIETKTLPDADATHRYEVHGKYYVCVEAYSADCRKSRKECGTVTVGPDKCSCTPRCD
jgi:hypothetical protein